MHVEPPGERAHLGVPHRVQNRQRKRRVDALHLLQRHDVQVVLLDDARRAEELRGVDVDPRGGVKKKLALFLLERVRQRGHVHAVILPRVVHEVVPPAARVLEVVVLLVRRVRANRREKHPRVGREQRPAFLHPLIPRDDDRVEHALSQKKVPHPLGDDHVHFLRELHLLDRGLHHGDDVLEPVRGDELPRVRRHVGGLHGVDLLRASLRRPDG
mmetsp:Transcript_5127/g.18351  ORF Transcript_5127/g.18351 Transcript_5127/m.18351 type:complete len:214 (+) Transcript_5127:1556-2197(+)|eukprot:30961-Pelagococcus_subviridis.AAC.21